MIERAAMLSMAIATAGAIETPPPLAPVFASVVVVFVADEASVRSLLASCAPSATCATAFTFTRSSATEAPTPTLAAPLVTSPAFACAEEDEDALREESPRVAFAVPFSLAVVAMLPATSANEPAKPTVAPAPAAPLVAVAARSSLPLMSAVKLSPFDDVVPALDASFVMFARVIATAAPMPAVPPVFALPSAIVVASADSLAWSVRAPPLEMETPTGIVAFEEALLTTSAIAAATLIGPALVDALGGDVGPEPAAPCEAAVPFAKPRSSPIWLSTPPADAPAPPSPGAPAADAVAEEDVFDGPVALKLTSPVATMLRSVVAVAV